MDGKRRFSTGNKTVDAVGRMHFSGNIVPSAWYETIVKDTAGCDSIALLILADIVYWYRPTEVRDEQTGEVVGMRKKFKADRCSATTSSSRRASASRGRRRNQPCRGSRTSGSSSGSSGPSTRAA